MYRALAGMGWALMLWGAGATMGTAWADLAGIVPEGAELDRIATGFQFTEGPAYDRQGSLCFSDIPANRIYRIAEDGTVSVFQEPSGKSNGLLFDKDGSLLACRHGERDVARILPDGTLKVVADAYQGKKLNSPNDCAVAADGAIYFTDPGYGLEGRPSEQDVEAVYRIAPDGTVTRVVDDMTKPNGIFVSPDGKTLYIADSEDCIIRAYPILADGQVGAGRTFADMKSEAEGVPDGMTLDEKGNIYCTGGGGIWVFNPEGEHLGTIPLPEVPANCTFGGPENTTLYVTARHSVYRVELLVPGLW